MKRKQIVCSLESGLNSLVLFAQSIILSKIIETLFNMQFQYQFILLLLGLILFNYLVSLHKDKLMNEIVLDYKKETMNKILSNQTKTYESAKIVKVLEKDCELIIEYKCKTLPDFIFGLGNLVFYFIYCFYKNSAFTLVIFVFCLLQAIIPLLMAKYFAVNYEKTMQTEEEIESYYFMIVDKFKKTWFIDSNYFASRLQFLMDRYYQVGMKSEFTAQLEQMLVNFLNVLSQFGLYFIGLFLVWKLKIDLATLMSMVVLGKAMILLSQLLMDIAKTLSVLKVAEKRVDDTIGENVELKRMGVFNQIDMNEIKVPFIQEKYCAKLNKNELVIIKGKNGSGKSTLLKTILNIETDYQGSILIDHQNIKEFDLSGLIYYVPQNNALLDFTVGELFAEFNSDLLNQLKEDFGIKDEFMNRQLKQCSSGQIKKIAIMCALMSNKQVLVFDEPESSLDEEAVSVFKKYLNKTKALKIIATNSNVYDEFKSKVVKIHASE